MMNAIPKDSKIPELLSPAGNLKKLKIALEYGADAVYGGVSHFSLRNRSGKEFNFDSFKEGVEYAHKRKKKIYVTINGFPFNSQLKLLRTHIEKMAELKPDAFIIATPGVVKLARQIAPEIPLHLSTQANVLNVLDAQVFYELGVKRIIAARELSLKDAMEIKKALPDLELEIFIHGSMCFAFSGRCLISALQNGRVPNRGSCANDCRFDYEYYIRNEANDALVRFNGKEIYARNPDNGITLRLEEEEGIGTHIFNAKDLNLASHIPMILQSGAIDSLKIEGRTKSSYYAGITALAYKRALEDYAKGDFAESRYTDELETLKNRGFSEGYLIHRPYEKLNTQNHLTAISEGSYQVNAEVSEDGKSALCRHTIRPNEPKEIVSAHWDSIQNGKNDIGEIFEKNGKKYLCLFKILLVNGKELESIHSGNENAFILPFALPPFSFLRQRV
ncbi:peptidase U32 family protein [uncultured Helicobacter sp.]|uniref:peptidase U32 family protein n=1 Tax=uncultured Helicobacter sp. TaxID=175537 RepID=UPI002604AC22|nr:peptidase U32 family protein [uncultured Helicobacter sp.]